MGMDDSELSYPIRVAAQKAGVSPFVIRSWERRYQAVIPRRSMTNRRMYSDGDVRRLRLLYTAVRAGYRIGHIANLNDDELEQIVGSVSLEALVPGTGLSSSSPGDLLHGCLDAVARMDQVGLEERLGSAQVNLSLLVLLEEVVTPSLVAAGENWHAEKWGVSQEHMLSATVRGMLQRARKDITAPPRAPSIVVTTPARQQHEIGALMVSLVAAAEGWHPTYLGPDMPAHDIVHAVLETKAHALALSVIHPCDDPGFARELDILREYLPARVPILVGGSGAYVYRDTLSQPGVRRLTSLSEFRAELAAMRSPSSGD
jgi:MerR family transcriptional regulator, light-induced transcriptional regulator